MKPVLFCMAALLLGLNAAPDAVHAQSRPADRWVWSLYESGGSVVLANEVPDTTRLRATLECTPGEGMAVLSLYDPQAKAGFARGPHLHRARRRPRRHARGGKVETTLRLDHPVFAAFVAGGELTVATGEHRTEVRAEPEFQGLLRRFGERCAGSR